jgi:hypothetical protein
MLSMSEDNMTDDTVTADPAPVTPPRERRELPDWLRRTIMGVLLVGALVGLVLTVKAATTGNDRTSESKPNYVDRLIPASGSEVLRQAGVGIDLAAGYDGYLIINGKEIRTAKDGLVKDLGTGLIQYVPGPGKPVEELNPEKNCALALVWKQSDGEKTAQPVSWCFTAS